MYNEKLYNKKLMQTALGKQKADLIIKGGQLVNVHTGEIYHTDVAIKGKRIAYVGNVNHCMSPKTQVIDAEGRYLTPGLIDPHIHPEACKLTMTRLAEALLPVGTTTIFAAMDDLWAVTGKNGVKFALDEAKKTPLRVIYHPYSRVPVTGLEPSSTVPFAFGSKEMKEVIEWPDTVGPMDMIIDFILREDEDMLNAMRIVQEKGLLVHGHDPMESGPRMQAFLTTGIRSDHVPLSAEEVIEKLRVGMWVMFCESPIAHVLPDVIKAITETNISTRHCTFCIDDMDTRDIFDTGHIDHQIRTAVRSGLKPITAIKMATLNAAEVHRVDHTIGSIAPGKYADILIVDDLADFTIEKVIVSGDLIVDEGELINKFSTPTYPISFYNTFNLNRPIKPKDLILRTNKQAKKAKVVTIKMSTKDLFRAREENNLKVLNGEIQPDLRNDILYCAVVERHKKTGNIGLGFVSGFNLNGGTIATSLAPPDGNIICLGSCAEDMALAINHTVEIGGGQLAVKDGEVIAEIQLPIGGIIANVDPEEMADLERSLTDVVHEWGSPIDRPFFFLMFMEIVGLPDLALTEHGLIDFKSQSYIDPVLEVKM